MNSFDFTLVSYVNTVPQKSVVLDLAVGSIAHNPMLKGGVLATIMWWLWFRDGDKSRTRGREYVIATAVCCVFAVAVARALAALLPFRLRPLHEPALSFIMPYGVDETILDGWSSFPSDHAVLFFTLSTGLLFLSRKAGLFALAYSAFMIGLPRVYLGLHYPTDVIAGAILGVSIGWFGNVFIVRREAFKSAFRWLESRPGVLYPMLFFWTYQIADLFSSSRGLLRGAKKIVQAMLA